MSLSPEDYVNRLLDPVVSCLTPAGAERLLDLELDPAVRQRLDELAPKASAGTLTEAEQAEYTTAVDLIDVIGTLQAKARLLLEGGDGATA